MRNNLAKEAIVDRALFDRTIKTLERLENTLLEQRDQAINLAAEGVATNDKTKKLRALGRMDIIEEVMSNVICNLCPHDAVEFDEDDEDGVCASCHAHCHWHRENDGDRVADEWFMPKDHLIELIRAELLS